MHSKWIATLLLTAAGGLAGPPGWAQRAAVAPLVPLPPVVRPTAPKGVIPLEGGRAGRQLPRQVLAPTTTPPTVRHVWPDPVYVINSRVLINGDWLNNNPQHIARLDVYKGADAPRQWRSLTEHGIIDITLKAGVKLKLKTKSLAAIRRQAKATGLVSFKLNGMRLEDTSLRVAAAAMAGLDVVRSDSGTNINIRLAPPKPLPPRHDPPGTIYIRGERWKTCPPASLHLGVAARAEVIF